MELLIPSTFGINERDRKLQVQRIGYIVRAAAIFGAERITIYKDDDPKADEERNAEIMEKYLSYAETPPYLRKALVSHDPDLKYANVLPPLQIISHGYSDEFREGVITATDDEGSTVEVGLDDEIHIQTPVEDGARVTVMNDDGDWRLVDPAAIEGFWTFRVENRRESLGDVLDDREQPVIGTSAQGEPVSALHDAELGEQVGEAVIVFGSAWRGLYELMDRGDCTESQFDGIYNTVTGQHTKTVRTDEAVLITLGVLNELQD